MDETVVRQPPDEKRLNPFAFPAETNVRFNLLIVAVIMLAIDVFILLFNFANGGAGPFDPQNLFPSLSAPDSTVATLMAALWQSLSSALLAVAIIGLAIAVVLGMASILYRSHPARIRRARRLSIFPPGKDARFAAEIESLASLAGVSPVPTIEVGEKSPPADGQVFGFKGRYSVRLGPKMRLVMRKSPPVFRGTVLHEMAHIANGDVGRAYFSQSLWVSVAWLLLTPAALIYVATFVERVIREISAAFGGEGGDLLRFATVSTPSFLWALFQLVGLLALFAALRGSLLRAREIYADWRAALWGARDGLEAILSANLRKPRPLEQLRLWQLHPQPRTRMWLLKNPRALFAIPDDVPLLVGALVGASVSGLLYLVLLATAAAASAITAAEAVLLQGSLFLDLVLLVMNLLFVVTIFVVLTAPFFGLAYLTAGTLGLQAQRDGVAAAAMRERGDLGAYLRLLVPAGLYAAGLQIGFVLAPVSFFAPVINLFGFEGEPQALLLLPVGIVLWTLGVTLLMWLWLVWARYASRRWMARQTGPKPPDRRRRLLTFYLTLLMWLILIPLLVTETTVWDLVFKLATIISSEVIVAITAIGLALFVGVAVAGWLLVEMLSLGRIACPACGHKSKHRQAVGRACEHCGADLAPWIIAQPRTA